MSAEALTNVSAALSTTFATRLARQMNRTAILARLIRVVPNDGPGGGKQVAWDVETSGATAVNFAEGADVSGFSYDPIQPATLPYGMYQSSFELTNLVLNAAAASLSGGQPREVGKLVEERIYGALTKIASNINADLFNGTGSGTGGNPSIIGFSSALIDTGSYAGISTTSYTEFASTIVGNGGTPRPLTLDLMSQVEAAIYIASGKQVTSVVGDPGVIRRYEGLFNESQRVELAGRAPGAMVSAGYPPGTMYWRGIPVIRDRNAPTGSLLFICDDNAEIRVLPWGEDADADGVGARAASAISSNGEEATLVPIPCMIYPLGRTGSAQKFVVETYAQLAVTRPNAFGLLNDVAE